MECRIFLFVSDRCPALVMIPRQLFETFFGTAVNYQCKSLQACFLVEGIAANFSSYLVLSVSMELPNPVPLPHINVAIEIRFHRWELDDSLPLYHHVGCSWYLVFSTFRILSACSTRVFFFSRFDFENEFPSGLFEGFAGPCGRRLWIFFHLYFLKPLTNPHKES